MKYVLLFQGIYFLITALWPLIDIDSFMIITGPKTDIWLVKTLSGILLAIALTFIVSTFTRDTSKPVIVLALTSSFALAFADVYYSSEGIIGAVYLLDAVIEIALMLLIIFVLIKQKPEKINEEPQK